MDVPRHQPLDAEVRRDVVLAKDGVVQRRVGSSQQGGDQLHGVQEVDRRGPGAVPKVVQREPLHRGRGQALVFEHHEHDAGDGVKALQVIDAAGIGAMLRVDRAGDDSAQGISQGAPTGLAPSLGERPQRSLDVRLDRGGVVGLPPGRAHGAVVRILTPAVRRVAFAAPVHELPRRLRERRAIDVLVRIPPLTGLQPDPQHQRPREPSDLVVAASPAHRHLPQMLQVEVRQSALQRR